MAVTISLVYVSVAICCTLLEIVVKASEKVLER